MDFNIKFNSSIHLLIDIEENIHYCNIENIPFCYEILYTFDIFNDIKQKRNGSKMCGVFFVEYEEVKLDTDILYLIIINKIQNLNNYEMNIDKLAYKDIYTGLYNRNLLEHIISGEIKMPNMNNYTVMLIDIDDLKKINDENGHIIGDKIIKTVSEFILKIISKEDIPIRYGGDEFIIIFTDIVKEKIDTIRDKIKEELEFKNNDNTINKIRVSIGISSGNGIESLMDTINKADIKMYGEKRNKRAYKKLVLD